MANNLLYEAAQVAPYLVAAARRLRHVSSDLAELTTVKVERNELREMVVVLEEEKRKFGEFYDLLAGNSFYRGLGGQL